MMDSGGTLPSEREIHFAFRLKRVGDVHCLVLVVGFTAGFGVVLHFPVQILPRRFSLDDRGSTQLTTTKLNCCGLGHSAKSLKQHLAASMFLAEDSIVLLDIFIQYSLKLIARRAARLRREQQPLRVLQLRNHVVRFPETVNEPLHFL